MQSLYPLENGQFGSKIKNAKNMRKTILQDYKSSSGQKSPRKKSKHWRNETISKIRHIAKAIAHAKSIAFAKWQFGSKIKNAKNLRKTMVQDY